MNKLSDNQLGVAAGGKLDEKDKDAFEELSAEIMRDIDNLSPEQKTELEKYLTKASKKNKR